MLLKPTRGSLLNKSHPLARGLIGYWLFNEGSGNKAFDLSGNGKTGTINGNILWNSGKFGSCLDSPGQSGDNLTVPISKSLQVSAHTIFLLFKLDTIPTWVELNLQRVEFVNMYGANRGIQINITSNFSQTTGIISYLTGNSGGYHNIDSISALVVDTWYMLACSWDGTTKRIYINGVENNSGATTRAIGNFDYQRFFTGDNAGFDGRAGHLSIYNRALSASEIALRSREPFCMFDRAWRPLELGDQIVELAGTSTALSSLSAIAKVSRKVGGTIVSTSNVEGSLSITGGQIVELTGTVAGRSNVNGSLSLLDWTEGSWLTEALFNGMTANAFKLGTSLSLGWFWVRVTGCSVLYRGGGMGALIDFANILAVSNLDASEISPPTYIPHDGGPNGASTYFYVVRRFNSCGYQELTLEAAVKVSISPSGELTEPQPNNIAGSKAEQVDSNKVRLTWFYCPIEQGSRPIRFNVYYDDRTGQIDYQNPLATISYKGRRFYSFQSSALEAGEGADEHLFAIRAEDADGIENISLARLKIQLDTLNPDAIDILRAEAV